jgi:SAM-dependent methyltransferase
MRPSVSELHAWYATLEGRRVARTLAALIAGVVKPTPATRFLAVGYPTPLLHGLDPSRFERLVIGMPHQQGAHRWPARRGNLVAEVDPFHLPWEAGLFDTVLLIHTLEHGDSRRQLREIWRVLAPAGRLIALVPNRLGLWSHFEENPFGQGRPFTYGQLGRLLDAAMFEPVAQRTAIPVPPVGAWRAVGAAISPLAKGLGGVRLALARKSDGLRPAALGVGRRARAVAAAPRPA